MLNLPALSEGANTFGFCVLAFGIGLFLLRLIDECISRAEERKRLERLFDGEGSPMV